MIKIENDNEFKLGKKIQFEIFKIYKRDRYE